MGQKYRVEVSDISNVAASKAALLNLEIGPRHHAAYFLHGYSAGTNTIAGAVANITLVEVLYNGRPVRTFTGAECRDYALLMGQDSASGEVPNTAPGVSFCVPFAESFRKDSADQDFLAWVTNTPDWKKFQIRITLGAAASPTLEAYSVVDYTTPKEFGYVVVDRQQVGASGTGFDINDIDCKGLLQQVTIYPDSGGSRTPSRVTLKLGGSSGPIAHNFKYEANKRLLLDNGMFPAASGRSSGVYDLVCDHDDLLNSGIPLDNLKTISLRIEAASAMSGSTTFLVWRFVRSLKTV